MPPSNPPEHLLARAKFLLAQQLGIDAGNLTVESTEQQTWDESLGCPMRGRVYAELGQFGYLIRLRAGAAVYDVHTNQTGTLVIHCEAGMPTLLAGARLPGR
jgi:hypothetical protein